MAPLAPYVPDQFEMARRALVSAAQPDGAVHVATDPSVGSSPFLYGRAKPKTPLEQQMEREQRRQLQEQQRYDQLQNELTFVPQWAADRMGPAAAMETRRRGAETLRSLPQPAGTPMSDAFARSEQDITNIPRLGAITRAQGDLDSEAEAMRFFSPNQVIMRTRQQQEAANAPARQGDQRFDLIRTLLSSAFNNPLQPPSWDMVNSILELAGMSLPADAVRRSVTGEAPPVGAAPTGQVAAPGAMSGRVMTMQQLQRMAEEQGLSIEDAMDEARQLGFTVQ